MKAGYVSRFTRLVSEAPDEPFRCSMFDVASLALTLRSPASVSNRVAQLYAALDLRLPVAS